MENKLEQIKVQKPFILAIDDAKAEIAQSINNAIHVHGLPFYIIDMILSAFSAQVKNGANNELSALKSQENSNDDIKQ